MTRRLSSALTGRVRVESGPRITSNGGGATADISVEDGETAVTTVVAEGGAAPIVYSKSGVDSGEFTINSSTGELAFSSPSDHGNPTDYDANNVYLVTVTATDDEAATDSQDLTITVLPPNTPPCGAPFSSCAFSESSFAG